MALVDVRDRSPKVLYKSCVIEHIQTVEFKPGQGNLIAATSANFVSI